MLDRPFVLITGQSIFQSAPIQAKARYKMAIIQSLTNFRDQFITLPLNGQLSQCLKKTPYLQSKHIERNALSPFPGLLEFAVHVGFILMTNMKFTF